MNPISAILARAIAPLLPTPLGRAVKLAVKDWERERTYQRAFDMAGGSGRWPREAAVWAQSQQSLAARHVLATRAIYLIDNSPIARSACDIWVEFLIGDGPSARAQHPDEATCRQIEAAWGRFYSDCDIEGGGADLPEFLRRVVRTVIAHGDAFVRLLTTDAGELRLQLLASEQVDASRNAEQPGGVRDINGIRVGPQGEVIGYWVLPAAPDLWLGMISPSVLIPASEILHVRDPRHAGSVRSVSWFAAVGTTILNLSRLEDGLLEKMRVSALWSAFITDPEGQSGFGEGKSDPQTIEGITPGSMRILPPGCGIEFPDMPGTEGAPELLRHLLRSVAAGLGIPYEILCADLSSTNFSSAKMGSETFRRRVKSLQGSMLVSRLLAPTWRRLVAVEILAGRLRAPGFVSNPDAFYAVTFLFPQPQSIDPEKDATADQILLANRIKSREQIIAERGRDIRDVDREIDADPVPPPAIRPLAPAANPVRA